MKSPNLIGLEENLAAPLTHIGAAVSVDPVDRDVIIAGSKDPLENAGTVKV